MLLKLEILLIFHLDISGKDINSEHFKNKFWILLILLVSHYDISGKFSKE